jgi:hypothetical protein
MGSVITTPKNDTQTDYFSRLHLVIFLNKVWKLTKGEVFPIGVGKHLNLFLYPLLAIHNSL